jgi:hypothetical protein
MNGNLEKLSTVGIECSVSFDDIVDMIRSPTQMLRSVEVEHDEELGDIVRVIHVNDPLEEPDLSEKTLVELSYQLEEEVK